MIDVVYVSCLYALLQLSTFIFLYHALYFMFVIFIFIYKTKSSQSSKKLNMKSLIQNEFIQ